MLRNCVREAKSVGEMSVKVGSMMKGCWEGSEGVVMRWVRGADWARLWREHSNFVFVGPTNMEIRSWLGFGISLSEGSGLMMPMSDVTVGMTDGVEGGGGGGGLGCEPLMYGGGDEAARFLEVFSARAVAFTDVDLCFLRTGPS